MKKSMSVFSLFAAGAMVLGGAGLSHADDLKVTGFADIQYFISNDQPALDPAGGKNAVESQFVVKGEVDFEKKQDNLTFRLDLDFPSKTAAGTGTGATSVGQTFANTNMSVSGLPGGPNTLAEHLEQLKFVWAITGEDMGNLWLEGGIFNSPIGYESQDAPDRNFISYGQLFGMVPSNLGGIQLGASHGPISASLLFVDDWRSVSGQGGTATVGNNTLPASEENSYGGTLSFNPMPEVGLSIGYLTSEQNIAVQDEDLLDIILSGSMMPSADLELSYGLEYMTDKNNDTYMATVAAKHGNHGLALRYDSMDCGANSAVCATTVGGNTVANKPTSFTVSASCDVAEALTARLEWSTYDSDKAVADADMLSLQFVANLM